MTRTADQPGLTAPAPVSAAELQEQIAQLTNAIAVLTTELVRRGETSVRLLKPAEVASLFGYQKSKIYALIAAGVIPSMHLAEDEGDGTLRVPLIGLQALIVQHLKSHRALNRSDIEWLSNLLSNENGADDAAP